MMRKWIPLLLIVAAVALTIFYYPQLPERIATHWNASGEADGWSSRLWGAWLLPLVMAALWFFLRALPHIDPRRANYEKFAGMYDGLIILILAFMLLVHVVVLTGAAGSRVRMDRIMMPAVGVFITIIGFMIPKAHPNWFVGIRTPWTLTSDLAWEKTHRIGGPLMVALGLLMIALTFVAPEFSVWILVAAAIAIVLFLFVYSYQVWKQDPLKR
jgi:uncharacterized membrane protein